MIQAAPLEAEVVALADYRHARLHDDEPPRPHSPHAARQAPPPDRVIAIAHGGELLRLAS